MGIVSKCKFVHIKQNNIIDRKVCPLVVMRDMKKYLQHLLDRQRATAPMVFWCWALMAPMYTW